MNPIIALHALEEIELAVWEMDIPSPTVPEYIELHEGCTRVMQVIRKWENIMESFNDTENGGSHVNN